MNPKRQTLYTVAEGSLDTDRMEFHRYLVSCGVDYDAAAVIEMSMDNADIALVKSSCNTTGDQWKNS